MTDVTAQYENDAFTTITNVSLGPTDTSITVAAGEGAAFPNVAAPQYFYSTLEDAAGQVEIVKVTSHLSSSDTFTVERGQDNTTAGTFVSGDYFEMRPNAAVFEELRDAITTKDNIVDVDAKLAAAIALYLPLAGGTVTGQVKQSVAAPLADDDLTRKDYVDQYNFVDLAGAAPGAVLNGVVLFDFITVRAIQLPTDLVGSIGNCGVAPSNAIVLPIQKNGVQVATMNFASAQNTATFSTQAAISFAAGDRLTVVSDSNMENAQNLRFTLTGVLVL